MAVKAENEDINAGLLKLETAFERPKITIDGDSYEIVSPGELSIQEGYRLRVLADRLANSKVATDLSDTAIEQLSLTLEQLCDIILQYVPADVRAKLSDANKLDVIEVFTMRLTADRTRLAAGAMVNELIRWAGERPSPGFSTSTAETPQAG